MVERLRRNLFRVVLILAVIAIIVVAIVRKTELNRLRHRIEDGAPRERLAAVQRLLQKDKLRDAMEDQPRWEQDHCLTALAFMSDYQALDQILKIKMWLDAPVDARATQTIEQWDETAAGPLSRAFQDKDANTRSAAITPATGLPTKETMIELCMDLMDAWDQYVRDAVRDVMSNAAMAEETAPLLAKVLLEKKPGEKDELTTAEYLRRRGTAIATLEKMKDPAIEPLGALLSLDSGADEKTRAQVCISLGSIGASPGDATVLKRAYDVAPYLTKALEHDPSWAVQRQAALALGRLQPVETFLDTPLDEEQREQVAAVRAAIRPLIEHLRHPQPDVRAAAAVALGQLRAEEAAPHLGAALADDDLRKGAGPEIGVAMSSIGEVCVPYLRAALNHPDPAVRELATSTLSTIGGHQSVRFLLDRLDRQREPAVPVRKIAATALRNLAETVRAAKDAARRRRTQDVALPPLATPMEDLAEAEKLAAEAVAKRRPGNKRRTILANAADKVARQLATVRRLCKSADRAYRAGLDTIGPLNAAVRATPYLRRARDIVATAEEEFPEACEDIKTPMKVQTELAAQLRTVRRALTAAMHEVQDNAALAAAVGSALPRLADALGDPDWHVYVAARDALTHMGAQAVPDLVAAMQSEDERVSYTAAQGLAAIGHPAVPMLVRHLADPDPKLAMWAAIALGDIGTPAIDELTRILHDTNQPFTGRANAARALGLCRDIQATGMAEGVVEALARAANEDESAAVRVEAIRALGKVRGKEAAATVIQKLRDPDDRVANEAMVVLQMWPAIQSLELGEAEDLMDVLDGPDPEAAERAAIVLAAQFREGEVPGIKGAGAAQQRESLRRRIASSLREVIEAPEKEPGLLRRAIDAYGAVALAADASRLEPYLTVDPDKRDLAQAACRALGAIGAAASRAAMDKVRAGETPPGSEPAKILVKHLADPQEAEMHPWYALALVQIRQTAVEPLMRLFAESDGQVRIWCAAVLGRIGKDAVNMLFDARGALAKQRRGLVDERGLTSASPEVQKIDDELKWYSAVMLATRDTLAADFVDNVIEEQKPTAEMNESIEKAMAELARLKAEEWPAELS